MTKKNIPCSQCIEEDNKRAGNSKYECSNCGSGYCERHYKELLGECENCVPYMRKIK